MKSRIISLNIGGPTEMHWNGKSVRSSMLKLPTPGPLVVSRDGIEGNSFANMKHHGSPDNILYAFGLTTIQRYLQLLKLSSPKRYVPGELGETLTLDHFDEDEISIGDVFQIGEVKAQASYPRIPCAKLNFRLQHPDGQRLLEACSGSGVYFRILEPGSIRLEDHVVRIQEAAYPLPLGQLYRKLMKHELFTASEIAQAAANGAVPANMIAKWPSALRT